MRNSRSVQVTYASTKSKNSQLFENLNDAYKILMPMLFIRNRESAFWKKGMCFDSELWSSVRISHWSKNFGFHCCAAPIIITSMPVVATCRVYVEWIILFVKIVNRYFKAKNLFQCTSSELFWRRFSENQGCVNFVHVLASCSFKAYCKLHRLRVTWLDPMTDI